MCPLIVTANTFQHKAQTAAFPMANTPASTKIPAFTQPALTLELSNSHCPHQQVQSASAALSAGFDGVYNYRVLPIYRDMLWHPLEVISLFHYWNSRPQNLKRLSKKGLWVLTLLMHISLSQLELAAHRLNSTPLNYTGSSLRFTDFSWSTIKRIVDNSKLRILLLLKSVEWVSST